MNKQLNLFEQNNIDDIKSEMLRRRKQILVHSCLYYQFNTNLIEDWQYDKIARRLAELQIAHSEISNNLGYHDKEFKGFGEDHCYSGFNLPRSSPEVVAAAERLKYITSAPPSKEKAQELCTLIWNEILTKVKENKVKREELYDFICTKKLSD